MKNLFTSKNSLELLASMIALGAFLGVLQSFVIGKHFIIPTGWLAVAVLFGNLARSGVRGGLLAKQILFWIFAIATCHTFFALFWAKTPRELLGPAFLYVYGAAFLILGFLSIQYARKNPVLK